MKKILILILTLSCLFVNGQHLNISSDLTYNFIHAVGSADSISLTNPAVQNRYYTIDPPTGFTWHECDGFTCVTGRDSLRVLTAGDYLIHVCLSASTANSSDIMRAKLYINGSASLTSIGYWRIVAPANNVSINNCYLWYKINLAVGDYISVRIANLSNARAITINDYKIYIEKKPE